MEKLLKIQREKMDATELFRSSLVAIITNKTRSFLTALGIIIGVGSVILLVSIGSGLQSFVTKQFEELGSNLLFVTPGRVQFSGGPPRNLEAKFDFDDVSNLEKLGDPIIGASGMISKGTTMKYKNKSFYGTVTGVEADYLDYRDMDMELGQFFSRSDVERSKMVVVIGSEVYEELFGGVRSPIGKEIDIAGRPVTVIGALGESGGGLGGGATNMNTYVYMPVTSASKVTGVKKPASVMVRTETPESVGLAARKIKDYFYRKNLTDDDFTVLEPKELLDTINSFLSVITAALSGIAAISLVVGGIGIANIMLVSVTERIREIGLRKALGATGRDILMQFLIEAVVLSLVGGGIGIALGWGLSLLLSQFIETAVTLWSIGLAFGISMVVGVVAGVGPAIRASNLDPIVALRHE